MKVVLTGTGSIYSKRNSASVLIDEKIIVDLPNGMSKQIMKFGYDITKIEAIVLTHFHPDHYWDMPVLWAMLDGKKSRESPLYIIGPEGLEDKLKQVCDIAYPGYYNKVVKRLQIQYIELKKQKQQTISILGYTIEPHEVIHGGVPIAYGFVINQKLGVTGDCTLCEGTKQVIKNSQVVIADCSCIQSDEYHMGIDGIKLLEKEYHKKMIVTHLRNNTEERLKKEKIENVEIYEDGDSFEI